jgi:hypothetical protein
MHHDDRAVAGDPCRSQSLMDRPSTRGIFRHFYRRLAAHWRGNVERLEQVPLIFDRVAWRDQ